MSKEPMVDAHMSFGQENDVRMIAKQLERIAVALERIVETRRKPTAGKRWRHMSTDEGDDDRILSFWGP